MALKFLLFLFFFDYFHIFDVIEDLVFVFLDLIDEMSPGVIKIQSPFLYVLMPMRIS